MGDEKRFSLGELAAAAGMTTRNVRAYQTRGLIPPPLRVGRRSQYTTRHLEALRAVAQARARGASLSLISDAFVHGDGVIDLTRTSEGGWLPAQRPGGASRDLSTLLARTRAADDPSVVAFVESLVATGVAVRDGRRIVAGSELVATVTALHRHGLPVALALEVATRAAESAAALAERLGTVLDGSERQVVDQVAHLAAGVLRGVLVDGLAAGLGTRG